ncbi:MAG: acetate--CoA ligase family protein [bacterium]|nr:acetate--CoA ligase family protein [bacterium]
MDLEKLFYPKSIAVIGASNQAGSVGNDLVNNLMKGFGGTLYFVNLKGKEINGIKSYPKVSNIYHSVDLAVIAVPSIAVSEVLEEVGQKDIGAAVIISAGFKEAGRADLEKNIITICKKYNIALIGPNCLGIINPEIKMNASFAASMPAEGAVAFVSQSGALCTAVIDYAKFYGVGFSKFVSIGNKAVVDDIDLLEYLFKDEKTKVIAMYIESLNHPQEFIQLINNAQRGNPKPVIVIKSGRTSAGASATLSHTGALAGSDSAYDALFRQAGVIRAQSVEDLFDLVRVFTDNELAVCDGVAVITNAGGPGVLSTDEIIANGLQMAKLNPGTLERLKSILPAAANIHNPIDILGDAKAIRYGTVLKVISQDENVKSIVVILTPQSMTEIKETAQVIAQTKRATKKPIVVTFMGEATVEAGVKLLQRENVAAVNFPEQAAKVLATMNRYAVSCKNPDGSEFKFNNIDKAGAQKIISSVGRKVLPEAEALSVLDKYGFVTLKRQVVKTAKEAKAAAKKIGTNLAMKIVSEDIPHKSDSGGVRLDIAPEKAGEKFTEIIKTIRKNVPSAKIDGVLLMEMAPKVGFEFILGSSRDPALGNLMMVGLGGILVEVLRDVTFALPPIDKADAKSMLELIKANKIFGGVRGMPPLDSSALVDCLGRLSQLLIDFPQIKEMDINPLLVLPKGQGVLALDGRMVLE